jgi:hypothetical protein
MRNGQPRIAWTKEEDAFLREHGPRFSRRTISKELNLRFGNNRSHQAVKFRCYALKIRSEAFHRPSGVARKWTPSEDLVLKQLLGSKSVKDVAEGLGRTPWSVVTRARKLGLPCRMAHGRMSVNDAIKKATVSRQTFLAGAKRIGVEIPFVSTTRREISDEDFEKVREHLEGRKRLMALKVLRVRPVKVTRAPAPVPAPVRERKQTEPEPVTEEPKAVLPMDRMETIRKRHVCMKAKEYFLKMGAYNATISLVEAARKSGARAKVSGGRVVHSVDLDVIEEAATASGYVQKVNKGVVIYCPLTKTDIPL